MICLGSDALIEHAVNYIHPVLTYVYVILLQELKIIRNQLREEVDNKDSSVKVQQLQKQNKELQQLVNKMEHVDKETKHTETALTGTKTDEVTIRCIVLAIFDYFNYVATYVDICMLIGRLS